MFSGELQLNYVYVYYLLFVRVWDETECKCIQRKKTIPIQISEQM